MSSQSRGEMRPTGMSALYTVRAEDTVLVSATPYRPDERYVDLGLDTSDQQTTICMTWGQLESIHHQLGIALRQRDAQLRGSCPVSGDPFAPLAQLPEGEKWKVALRADLCLHETALCWAVQSDQTGVVYQHGLTHERAWEVLDRILDTIPTVQLS